MTAESASLENQALLFSQALDESKTAYQNLLQLEVEQKSLIESNKFEKVAEKIEIKNSALDEIRIADARLRDQYDRWRRVRDSAPTSLRDRLQGQVDDLQSLIGDLLEIQSGNEERIKIHGAEIGQKLRDLQKKKTAHQNYRQKSASEAYRVSKFYDRKS